MLLTNFDYALVMPKPVHMDIAQCISSKPHVEALTFDTLISSKPHVEALSYDACLTLVSSFVLARSFKLHVEAWIFIIMWFAKPHVEAPSILCIQEGI